MKKNSMQIARLCLLLLGLAFTGIVFTGPAHAQEQAKREQIVIPAGSRTSSAVPAQYFTGTVRLDPVFQAEAPARMYGSYVTFEPGARSNWHTHPLGQTLIVTFGTGLTQQWGGPVQIIRQGDVVMCPPGVKHWHGAAPNSAMTHLALGESLDGKSVEWMEKVSDEQYRAR